MELRPDWAHTDIREHGQGGASITLPVDGLREVRSEFQDGLYNLGFEQAPLASDGEALWEDLMVNFNIGTVTIVLTSTDHGTEIRRALDLQMDNVATEIDRLEVQRREQEELEEQRARERQNQLDRLRADLAG
jgi:hypothetical protein